MNSTSFALVLAIGAATTIVATTVLSATAATQSLSAGRARKLVSDDDSSFTYDISDFWESIPFPDEIPLGYSRGVPQGCECVVKEEECTKFDCVCPCDLTAGMCDANCCCDPECSPSQVAIFKDVRACTGPLTFRVTAVTCVNDEELQDFNPKYRMKADEFIETNLLCIVVDNNPSAGNFYQDPGTVTALRAFCDYDTMPTYSWMQYGLCTAASKRFSSASSSPAFATGDAIPLAELKDLLDTSVKTSLGGYLSLPTAGVNGLCNDQNPVGFMQPMETSCRRQVVENGQCADGAFLFNETVYLLGTNPAAVGNFATDSFAEMTIASICTYDIDDATTRNCTSPSDELKKAEAEEAGIAAGKAGVDGSQKLELPHASDLSGGRRGCQNVLRSLHLTVTDDGEGRIISAAADAVVYEAIEANSTAYVTQTFSVTFVTELVDDIYSEDEYSLEQSWELGNLLTRPRSGNAGYQEGLLVNTGILETKHSDANTTNPKYKSAVWMLVNGMALLAPSASGGCDASRASGVRFRVDEISGCMLSLDLEGLARVCNAFSESRQLPVDLPDWWTDVVEGRAVPVVGAYGNADPLDAAQWITMEVDDLSATADVAMYNSQRKQCDNIVTSLNVEFMYANMGERSNPQRKIVAARMWYGTDSWRFRQSHSSAEQKFGFYTTVIFAELQSKETGAFVPPTPPLLPQLPLDLFYPFALSAASGRLPTTRWIWAACLGATLYICGASE